MEHRPHHQQQHHHQHPPYGHPSNEGEGQQYLLDEDQNKLVERVLSYSLVNYFTSSLLAGYSYAKHCNSFVKAGLETAEYYSQPLLHKLDEYSHQPPMESLLHRVDQYGCRQLDKIESRGKHLKETYEVIKPKTIQSLENVANKIHGTPVETALLKTVGVVDVVVDSLLPPDPSEHAPEESTASDDQTIIDRTAPVINKLKSRINKDSLKRLPSQTYAVSKDFIFRNADAIPQLHYCVGMLSTAAHRVHDVSANTQAAARTGLQKGTKVSKATVEYAYNSLHNMTHHLATLVEMVKKLDPEEAKATVAELTNLILQSKDELLLNSRKKVSAARLKEDISRILQKAGDLLSQQVAAGYNRVHTSDNAAIRKSVETIETIVGRVVESFSNPSTQQQQNDCFNGNIQQDEEEEEEPDISVQEQQSQ